MSDANITLVRLTYDSYARRDLAMIWKHLSPQIEIYQASEVPWGGTYRGHDGALEFFRKLNAFTDASPMPEEYFAGRPEMWLRTLHIRDLTQRRAVIERHQPKPRLSRVVRRFHNNLTAVSRNVEIEDRKTGRQRLGSARLQVSHHHLSKIPVIRVFVGLLSDDAV